MSGNRHLFSKLSSGNQAGFGLIELIVSISIMVMVIGTVLARQDAFNSSSLLRSQALDLALQIREVQLTAVSAEDRGEGTGFRGVYGVYFDMATTSQYITFRDANNNFFYDDGSTEALLAPIKLDPRFVIKEVRLVSDTGTRSDADRISIVYQRPNFDARFFTSPGFEDITNVALEIEVALRSDTATSKIIEVTKTGQISVN